MSVLSERTAIMEMILSKGKTVKNITCLYRFVILFAMLFVCMSEGSRPLEEVEKERLYSVYRKKMPQTFSSIDVAYSKRMVYSSEFRKKRGDSRQQKNNEMMNKGSKRQFKSFGAVTKSGEEVFFYGMRIRIKDLYMYREDVIIFENEKQKTRKYDSIHINANNTNFKIDKKRKTVTYDDKLKWGANRDVLVYGSILANKEVVKDIIQLCRIDDNGNLPNIETSTKEFRHKEISDIKGIRVDVLELFDLEKNRPSYEIFLDVNDWRQCYKLVLYNDEGTGIKQISEFSKFSKDKENKILYPHLITLIYFDKECKEKTRDIINIEEVSMGLSIPSDVFELNIGKDYTIIDRRMDPVLVLPSN